MPKIETEHHAAPKENGVNNGSYLNTEPPAYTVNTREEFESRQSINETTTVQNVRFYFHSFKVLLQPNFFLVVTFFSVARQRDLITAEFRHIVFFFQKMSRVTNYSSSMPHTR